MSRLTTCLLLIIKTTQWLKLIIQLVSDLGRDLFPNINGLAITRAAKRWYLLTKLSKKQANYIDVPIEGPFKSDIYKY